MASRKLHVGDWVEVRSKDEILATLDKNAQLEGMPFMAEMFAYCGHRFQVLKSAHKTCDTVFPVRGRSIQGGVHLETRCNGEFHGGCQASCLLFWKDAWLKPLDAGTRPEANSPRCSEGDVFARGICNSPQPESTTYVCQATQLPYASKDLEWWHIRQYVEDYSSGNVSLWQIISGGVYSLTYMLSRAGIGLGRPIRWFYDKFHRLWNGTPFPRRFGQVPPGKQTPTCNLNLQTGELVRIKSYNEILSTLDANNKNRGLLFDAEEVPYCGGTYRVSKRVNRIVSEKTGKMLVMKEPCIILDNVVCQSRFSDCRMFCPRSIYSYWREIWLERV